VTRNAYKTMKVLKTNPGAKRLVESLRNMGYDCSTAIADLIDNSITANASEIHIEIIPKQNAQPAAIVIADNGKGMDKDELHEAMRFGAYQEYSPGDLGKYGLGLKTSSLSQCRTLSVCSKPKAGRNNRPRRNCMRWDVDHVYETDDWNLLVPSDDELEPWEKKLLNHTVSRENGTVVLWTNLDEALPLLSSPDARERENFLAHLIEEINGHLRMVFHRFMQGVVTGRRKVNIYIGGEKLCPWDPFCRNESTQELDIIRLPVVSVEPDGSKLKEIVTVSPYILPREDEFSDKSAWKDASGPRNWNQQQGFYFYRNNRLLQAGGWSRLRSVDEHTKLLRVSVDFPNELDRAFSINVTKMRARFPAEIRDKIASQVAKWARTARTRYDRKLPGERKQQIPAESSSPEIPEGNKGTQEHDAAEVKLGSLIFTLNSARKGELEVTEAKTTGQITIAIPLRHDLSVIFDLKNSDKDELRKICLAAIGVLEAVHEKKMSVSHIPVQRLKKILQNYL